MLRRILFFLLIFSFFGSAQSKHPFTFEDMMQLKRVGEPAVSPDSKWVGFSAVDVNLDANTKTPHLWIVSRRRGRGEATHSGQRTGRRPGALFARWQAGDLRVRPRRRHADLGAGLRQRCRRAHGRSEESHRDLDRGFGRHLVAGRQERSVRFLSLPRLQGRCLQQAARRRTGQVEGEGAGRSIT